MYFNRYFIKCTTSTSYCRKVNNNNKVANLTIARSAAATYYSVIILIRFATIREKQHKNNKNCCAHKRLLQLIAVNVTFAFCRLTSFRRSTWPPRCRRTSRGTKSWADTRPPGAAYGTAGCWWSQRTSEVRVASNWSRVAWNSKFPPFCSF